MAKKITVVMDGAFYAIDFANALEALFDSAYESYAEHDDVEELKTREILIEICEAGSGICADAAIKVDREVPDETIREQVEAIIRALETLLGAP